MFAIVQIGAKQYKVAPKDIVVIDKIVGEVGDAVTFSDVLLLTDDKNVTTVGTPFIKGSSVKAKILTQEQGEKIAVRRYKHKSRYRRHTGFRAQLTRVEVTDVTHA